ncbi:hypothetical protein RhiirA4_479941 [Rhizophagus irregularis]|uniref:FAR1 domain-containing protein n=1 Tax=Rhizophagus irregularis TaxID=588596 RepID=A0A2I1HH59_9GLOM|nr:hypothetical protein RhiirA4_479941 [Rhizophagus irregularis]
MENFKLFSYGFIHFENEHYREVFFNKVKGLRINLDKEKKVVVKFQPVKRKFDHHSNKHDPVGRPCHDLFDNRTHFIIIVSLPSIVEENEIELHMEEEEIIISGKYKELNFDGNILKKLIPVGNFEYTFTLPSNMSYNNKCNKRIRSGSPDNYEEEYIALILDDSSNICEKENEKNIEAEQINKRILVNIDNSEDSEEEMEIKLHVGQSFQTWLDAEKFLNQYSLKEGFSIRRKRTEKLVENGIEIIRKITWECCCAGKYQAKKVINPENQRNKKSKCTDCQWHVNGNLPKSSSNISFTTVVNEHNHQMIPSPSATIAKHRKLDEDIIEFINFYVLHGTTGARNIKNLLNGQFPGRNINQKNLYNAIQMAKKNLAIRQNYDASDMLQYLYFQKADDSRWFIETKFDGPERRLCGLIWMSPDQQHA